MTICNTVANMTNRNASELAQHLTREEAADLLRVSVSTIDRYLKDGTLPKAKLGKRLVRVERSAIEAFLSTPSPVAPPSDGEGVPAPTVDSGLPALSPVGAIPASP